MSEDQKSIKAFLHITREKADVILSAEHVNNEAKTAIKDLLQICNNFESLLTSNVGSNADTNLLKKRYEQSKSELKKAEEKINIAKESMQSLVAEVVKVSNETNTLLKGLGADTESPTFKALTRIKHSIAQMASIITGPKK